MRYMSYRIPSRWRSVLLLITVLWLAAQGNCQLAGTGSIQGEVVDSTNAIIPDAVVTITNKETAVKHEAKTDGNGRYSFPNIDIGTYTLEATAPSFGGYRRMAAIANL